MASFCAACSRRLLSVRPPARLAPVSRPRPFSLLTTSRRVDTPLRALPPTSHRSATTSSIGSSSSAGPHLPPIPTRPNIKVTAPSLAAIKEEGYLDDDVKLLPPEEAFLNISPEAVQQLVRITSREPLDILQRNKLALRVGVESGGCHGYQYLMDITEERGVDDYVMQPEGVHCIPIVVDLTSLGLLKGATLHHATELIGSSFRLQDNPQAKEGGACGCGVSWEAK
ncbi:hypothetical protein B9479_001766 [Cryptococcus floricola]|uniref:FeS cluster biogenesis domain-containing protein n=1 Tax=Cryptococcus floricola TaxID=2591691 RepID=A0A5D3B4A0_9TREE|nr:hypothetical protein B9479_001766 [Cryptococcus floricola]